MSARFWNPDDHGLRANSTGVLFCSLARRLKTECTYFLHCLFPLASEAVTLTAQMFTLKHSDQARASQMTTVDKHGEQELVLVLSALLGPASGRDLGQARMMAFRQLWPNLQF